MKRVYKVSRRNFLGTVAVAAGAAVGAGCVAKSSPWRFLTAEEARTLGAACDQIIPPDQDPGAEWAGVVNYIDRQLCGTFRRNRKDYREGLAGIEESSRILHGKSFAELELGQQHSLLQKLEDGSAPGKAWKKSSSSEFFSLLIEHTRQGFYGDPRHGGNRDAISWKMLGLPYPPIRGRLHYNSLIDIS